VSFVFFGVESFSVFVDAGDWPFFFGAGGCSVLVDEGGS
jgi:hypothetical protein